MDERLAQHLSLLNYFRTHETRLLPPAIEDWIVSCELALRHHFSPQVREFLLTHNGSRIIEIWLYGVPKRPTSSQRGPDIMTRYLANDATGLWNKSWLELGSDGFGNYFVADLANPSAEGEYPILIVDHEEIGRPNAAKFYAVDYFTLIAKVIEEMISLYEPDGKRRRAT